MTPLAQITPLTDGAILPAGWDLPVRLLINLACVLILVRGVYFRIYRRSELQLTFIAFNLVIFLIAYMLNGVNMSMGAAFGLFAVFSMLRFRTEGISVNDMTYLFLCIALGLLMAVDPGGWVELGVIAVTVIAGAWLLEAKHYSQRELAQPVLYDNLGLVSGGSRQALLDDLRTRTGLPAHRVEIREIDLLKEVAQLTVYYRPRPGDQG